MSLERLQKKLTTGLFIVPASILATVLLRIHSGIDLLNVANASTLLIQIGIALALLRVNHIFSVIRTRTILPAVVYLLFVGTDVRSFTDLNSAIISVCFLLALTCCFASYQRKESQAYLFNITLLLASGSLLWMPLILFLPLFWWVFIRFHALNVKSITASFLGLFIFSLGIVAYGVYQNDLSVIQNIWPLYGDLFPLQLRTWALPEIIHTGFTGLLLLLSFLHFQQKSYAEKIKTRAFLYVLYSLILFLAFCLIFSDTGSRETVSILRLASAFAVAHYFTLSQCRFTACVAFISILFYIAMYFFIQYQYLFAELKWIDLTSIF